jgi:hypothetical protein
VFTIGPSSSLILDSFVYDPSTGAGSIAASFLKGVFRWVTGNIARRKAPYNEMLNMPVGTFGIRGTDFTVNLTQTGNMIAGTTSVSSGVVDQLDPQGNLIATLTAGQIGQLSATQSTLVASVLPTSRSVATTNTATAFAAIINLGPANAVGCTISPPQNLPVNFLYQTTDPATNNPTGAPNVPVDIPAGATQTFVFAITPTSAFAPTDVQLTYTCNDSVTVAPLTGINTLLLSASNSPVPDIVALAATTKNDGIVHVPGAGQSGAFAVATVNIGAGANITATADTGNGTPPVAITLCQTNPTTGACLATPAASVTTNIASNATPTFGIFVNATAAIPLDPANARVFVRFEDSGKVTRGSTSVAVTTQ